jgi:hypothetical protein
MGTRVSRLEIASVTFLIFIPSGCRNKAISDGAILSYLATDRMHPPRLLQAGDQAPGGVDDAITHRSSKTLSEDNTGSARPLTPEHRDEIIRTGVLVIVPAMVNG